MRRRSLAVLALCCVLAPATAQDSPLPDWLEKDDPLGAALAIEGGGDPADLEALLRRILDHKGLDEKGRDNVRRLLEAVRLAQRVREGEAAAPLPYWLALDDLARAARSRNALLDLAIPAEAPRAEALKRLDAARAMAQRFCLDWNEHDGAPEVAKANAALRAELEKAGPAAAPHLLEVLTVLPADAFVVIEPERGVTARQQVRALYGIGFLGLRDAAPYLVFHTTGPSLTSSSVAATTLQQLTGAKLGADVLGEPPREAIDAWWREHRDVRSPVLDHFVRHLIAYLREPQRAASALPLDWAEFRRENARLGVEALERLLGMKLRYDAEADPNTRLGQLDTIERRWWDARGG